MKKVLLLSLGLAIGFGAFAQEKVKAVKPVMAPYQVSAKPIAIGTDIVNANTSNYAARGAQSVVVNESEFYSEVESMYTAYDLQSNSYLANRMYQLKDGSVAVTATMTRDENDANTADRGTGYNFASKGMMGKWSDIPEYRIEANATGADLRTGWPSIAPYGAEGEILVNHSEGLKYWIREKAGQGVWDGPHDIPNPQGLDGQEYNYQLSWPRIVTTGENNEIVHIFACAQYTVNSSETSTAQFYLRSEGLQEWDIQWSPLATDDMHMDLYSADDYAAAANGDNVAVVYCGTPFGHVMLYKSTDGGLTWTSRIVWENPTYGHPWDTDEESLFDEMYNPVHASVALDNNGVAHVAISTGLIAHKELGFTYSLFMGLSPDGIAYWNDERETPIQSAYNDNPFHALRLWWPVPEDTNYIFRDSINFCGFLPPHPETGISEFNYEYVYYGNVVQGEAGDYLSLLGGLSAYPAIAVDPAGNVAVAFSSPDMTRFNGDYYLRTIYVSYKPANDCEIYGQQVEGGRWYYCLDNFYQDFLHTNDECTYVSAVSNPVKENIFWFSCLSDDTPGFYTGSITSQSSITTSTVNVFKYSPVPVVEEEAWNVNETKDVVYNIFPNPASEQIFVASSNETDAVVTFSNIAGQVVKVVNTNLTTGENSINISDLNSGVYFCTVKANGYTHTSKVVVK